ncbi:MAG: fluoride efflux transporter FluC [Planctomycetota bacterium]|jgi:CrcB protein
MLNLLYLFLAGGLGTLARYGITRWLLAATGGAYPWGTLLANGLGCFLFGLLWIALEDSEFLDGHGRMIVLIGFLGGFTTFSTFAFEVTDYMIKQDWLTAALTFLGHNLLGVIFVGLGISLGRQLG